MPFTAGDHLFQKKGTTSVSFLLALLLFFLPFVQVTCNDKPFVQNTGIGLAFGTDYKMVDDESSVKSNKEDAPFNLDVKREKGKMYVMALVALIAGATGLFVSLTDKPFRSVTSIVSGILAAICLLIVMLQIKSDIKTEGNFPATGSFQAVKVSVAFTLWFYLSVIFFLLAAFFGYQHYKLIASIDKNDDSLTGNTKKHYELGQESW